MVACDKRYGARGRYIPTGTSNNVTLPAIDFGSDDFTVEMWARDLDTSEMGYFWNFWTQNFEFD